MAAALVVVPGVAHAEETSSPALPTDGGAVSSTVAGVLGNLTPTQRSAAAASETGASEQGAETTAATQSVPSLDPAQLAALLAPLGVTPDCFTAVQGDAVAVLGSIPATVQQLITMLEDKLGELQEDPENGAALL